MSEYLSKEEVRQWRSSLEKITLEDFAARLGKVINEEKETRDIVDIVLEKEPVLVKETYKVRTEKINTIAQKAFSREKEITNAKIDFKPELKIEKPAIIKEEVKIETAVRKEKEVAPKKPLKAEKTAKKEVKIEVTATVDGASVSFKKPLTDREQMVFNHFLANKNSIVYAKDLAQLLDLPRDYVYKYIKNLRNKIAEDALENADNGGYVLRVQ